MSHFTVLVIGGDPARQLAGYHEFECTGFDDEYVQDVDVTADLLKDIEGGETLESALEDYGMGENPVEDESQVDKSDAHKYRYAIVKDGKLIKAVERTNLNKKWDWYQLGGRWNGFFKLKNGRKGLPDGSGPYDSKSKPGYANQAFLENIDVEGMRDEKGDEAARAWDKAHAVFGDTPPHKTWQQIRDEHDGSASDKVRAIYWEQPRMQAWKKVENDFAFHDSADNYLCLREDYVAAARTKAMCPFAVVKDGEWFERGKMGWWACVSDEKSDDEWIGQVAALIDGLPGDTLLSIYDCHI